MKTQFPTQTGFSGLYVNGYRSNPISGDTQLLGTIVVKRNYQIDGKKLVAIDDPDGIRLSDQQEEIVYNGRNYWISLYEHDLAVYKPLADIIVRDDYLAARRYHLRVQTKGSPVQTWLRRDTEAAGVLAVDADAHENLFGWQPRYEGERLFQGGAPNPIPDPFPEQSPAPVVPDMSEFENLFFNGYRREFASAAEFPKNQFQAQDSISMTRSLLDDTGLTTLFNFTLGQESIRANLYLYSGKGPDKDRYWCVETLPNVRLDTLVITPSTKSVYAVWRGVWDYARYPSENYRKLDVIAQGVSNG